MPGDLPAMDADLRTHVGHVLTDYRDGLLDGIEDAVEAIMEHPEMAKARKALDEQEMRRKLGHSVGRAG